MTTSLGFFKRLASWDALAIFFLAAWPWLLFWQAALGTLVFAGGDLSSFFYPTRLEYARALAEGRLPLWSPDMSAGFPLFAEGQIAALYPVNLILYRLLPTPLAINYSILFHLSWASVGMYLFVRSLGLRFPSATLAGFVFAFGGFFLAHLQHLSLIATAAWLGWILFLQQRAHSARRANERGARFWFALAALALGLQFLSGFPQIALFNAAIFFAMGALDAWRNRFQDAWRKPIAINTACILLGLLIGAAQLVPTAELVGLSTRNAFDQKYFLSYSLELSDLPQFASPYTTLGEPSDSTQEFWGFVGVSTLLLALSAFLFRRNARTLFFGAMALVVLALALGGNNPLYATLYSVPIFNQFRVPARFLFLVTFALANLAAIGLEELLNRARDSALRGRVLIILGTALVALMLGLIGVMPFGFWMGVWKNLPGIFAACAVAFIALAIYRVLPRAIICAAILGLVFIELAAFSAPFIYTLDAVVPRSMLTDSSPMIAAMDKGDAFARAWTNNYHPRLRPNRLLAYGKSSAQIYSPLALERNENYNNNLSPAMLNLLGIRYVMSSFGELPPTVNVPDSTAPVNFLREHLIFPPLRVMRVEISSFTIGTANASDGTVVGEILLSGAGNISQTLSVRLGQETAEWNLNATPNPRRNKPANAEKFLVNFPDQKISGGEKFLTRFDLTTPILVTGISARQRLQGGWTIDRVTLFDDAGNAYPAPTLAGMNDYALAYVDEGGDMYENRDVLPRAFVVHRAEIVDDARVLAAMNELGFDPRRVAYLATGEAIDRLREIDAARVADEVSVVEYRPERVTYRVKSMEAGYLILADTFYPSWVARIDGQEVAIYRADYIFRAVRLSAGEHTIMFEYQPVSLFWGGATSGIAILLILGYALGGMLRK